MYCPKCSAENSDDAQRCLSCGIEFGGASATPRPQTQTSGLAVAAMILAILALCTSGITLLPAIICGIIALVKISGSDGSLKGKGMAITGLVLSGLFILSMPLLLAILMPALSKVRHIAERTVCETNLRGLGIAMVVYADSYDDKLPTADEWCDLLIQEVDVSDKSFRCLGAPEGTCTYALNKNVATLDVSADTVLIFECSPGWNQSGGPELLTTEYHQGEGCNVVFVDGHTEFVEADRLSELDWTGKGY